MFGIGRRGRFKPGWGNTLVGSSPTPGIRGIFLTRHVPCSLTTDLKTDHDPRGLGCRPGGSVRGVTLGVWRRKPFGLARVSNEGGGRCESLLRFGRPGTVVQMGAIGFDWCVEAIAACRGWSVGLVKSRPNRLNGEAEAEAFYADFHQQNAPALAAV